MKKVSAPFYLHASKGDWHEDYENLFPNPTEAQTGNVHYTGYEVSFEGYWTDEGHYYATHVEGVPLANPVKF